MPLNHRSMGETVLNHQTARMAGFSPIDASFPVRFRALSPSIKKPSLRSALKTVLFLKLHTIVLNSTKSTSSIQQIHRLTTLVQYCNKFMNEPIYQG